MLPQGEKLKEKARLRSLPLLERPITVRLKFRKVGSLQYISHLDLQRTFQRVLARACLPVWYTKGFNPHPKMVFSTPLSVGAQSEYEFLDIRIDREMSPEEIMERMNRELTEELKITKAYIPTRDFSEIEWATYELELHTKDASQATADAIFCALTTSPMMVLKKSKAGEKEVDLVPMITDPKVNFEEESKAIRMNVTLRASSVEYLNPELLITGLRQACGILSSSPVEEWYSVLRTGVLKQDLTLFE